MPPHGRGAFDQGKTAWQVLGRDAYEFLKPSHQWRLDEWDKDKCVSWACTLLLRHASSYEQKKAMWILASTTS